MSRLLSYIPLGELVAKGQLQKLLTIVGVALLFVLLPALVGFDHRMINVVLFVAIFAISALGLNVVVGNTGLLDLGYVMFIATGAVLTFILLLVEVGELPDHVYETVVISKSGDVGFDDGTKVKESELNAAGDGLQRLPDGRLLAADGRLFDSPGQRSLKGSSGVLWRSGERGVVLPVGSARSIGGSHPFVFDGSILLLMLISGLVCALLGVLRGIPTLKLTGDYYAIVTLGIAEIVYLIYFNNRWLTGGANGMSLGSDSTPTLFGGELYYDTWNFYYLVLGALGLCLVVMDRLDRSRVGRSFSAIRLDETAARACGIDTARTKLTAFAVSGFLGGVSGSLYAVWLGTIATKDLDVWLSILVLCAVVLGGMGSLRGVLLGSLIFFPLREVLREEIGIPAFSVQVPDFFLLRDMLGEVIQFPGFGVRVPPEASNLVYGLLLIFVMRFRPQGLLPRSVESPPDPEAEKQAMLSRASGRLYAMEDKGD